MRRKRNNIIKVAPIALLLALTSCASSKKDDVEVSDMINNANNYILVNKDSITSDFRN